MATYFAGIDVGSTTDQGGDLEQGDRRFGYWTDRSRASPPGQPGHGRGAKAEADISFQSITYIVSTGYGRINVPFADKQFTEITCHAKGIVSLFPEAKTIIDIGGQDVKGIKIDGYGKIIDFAMNDKCAAGTGRFIEVIADTLGVPLDEVGTLSLQSKNPAKISNICTIWAQQEVCSQFGRRRTHFRLTCRDPSIPWRTGSSEWSIGLKVEEAVIVTGGGGKNRGLLKALSEQLEVSDSGARRTFDHRSPGCCLAGKGDC